jgi:hypothetical protein
MERTISKIKLAGTFTLVAIFLFTMPVTSLAFDETATFELTQDDLEGADELSLEFLLGGARVNITRSDDDDFIVKAEVTYDSSGTEPTLLIGETGDMATARFSSGNAVEYINYNILSDLQEWDITIGDYDIDTDLSFIGGGIKGEDIDLGGLPLRNFSLTGGGADMAIDFSTPTSTQMETLNIEGGGLRVAMSNIGNTDFEKFNLIGGGIIADLDFNGKLSDGDHEVTIVSAGGSMDIEVPSDAGERASVLSVGASVSFRPISQWRKSTSLFVYKNYRTTDYSSEDVKIDMEIIAVGSIVDIDRN